jgi:Zn-finger nucleic acid-binding protein
MTKDRFQQMIPVTIDRCRKCDRMWLDTGEYNLVRRLYVEMMLSEDPHIVRLREKVGRVGAAWEARNRPDLDEGSVLSDIADLALPGLLRILIR